jgi:ribosome maturation factor RimP
VGEAPHIFLFLGNHLIENVNETLEAVVRAELDSIGFDLVELRKGGSRSRPLFEVRLERRDGAAVSVDDCARASRVIEAKLEGSGLVPERYVLQVSSPGDRPLRTPEEWKRFVGRWVSVLAPTQGGRFEGKLLGIEGESGAELAAIEVDGEQRHVSLAAVKEARLAFRI